jgi:hypothetical protein
MMLKKLRQQQQVEAPPSLSTSPFSNTVEYIELSHTEYPILPEDGKNEYRIAGLHSWKTNEGTSFLLNIIYHFEIDFLNLDIRFKYGITLFSTALYSSFSLLPVDPQPYTALDAPRVRKHQPTLTPDTYRLPDGNWRWVSTRWMIGMCHKGEAQWEASSTTGISARGWCLYACPARTGPQTHLGSSND